MANFLYVDNSNVWIEGRRVSAVRRRLAPDLRTACDQDIQDIAWAFDFGRLFEFAGGDKKDVARAVLYGSRPPQNDSLWRIAERKGFEPIVFDRSLSNKEKKIDTQIASDIMEDSYERMMPGRDEVTLVAGDADYVPVVEKVIKRNFVFHVVFWNHAARELKEAATKFITLDNFVDHLQLKGERI